ncbi:hypothetical protein B5S31_g3260 [[Candida] boidinii]|nr:hypothetical protein B5S31_g3260 [[Candida] boidinii]OWB78182.1 hypothetical protein B5S32_g2370 [[Candida] boidinii]
MSAVPTPGSILKQYQTQTPFEPIILQSQQHKLISADEEGHQRIRFMLNDGKNSINAMFKPDSSGQTSIENLTKYCYLKISDLQLTHTSSKRFLVFERAEVVGQGEKPEAVYPVIDSVLNEHPEWDLTGGLQGQAAVKQNSENGNGAMSVEPSPAPELKKKPSSKPDFVGEIYSIDQLSPYQSKWTIKARVSFKGQMRTYHNSKGDGKLFNCNFLDETGEIRATGFNDAADKFYDLLQEGKVYYISRCRMNSAKPQFSNLKHQYELQFDRDTQIEECDDDNNVPKLHFDFVPLNEIQNLDPNAIIDVIGVLKDVKELKEITARSTGKPFNRRDVVIVDPSHFAMNISLWNKDAVEFNLPSGSVIALKGAKVQDFGGRSLSLTPSGSITFNPDTPESHKLKGWYDSQGVNENFKSLKQEDGPARSSLNSIPAILERKTIRQAEMENLGHTSNQDFFNLKATVTYLKTDNFSYPACLNDGCNRKVLEQPDGTWRCEKCQANHDHPNHRYILTCSVLDETGQLWLTLFDNEATKLIGMSAGDLIQLKENENTSFKKLIDTHISMKEFAFRLRARLDEYNGQERVRYTVSGLSELDFKNESEALCKKLDEILI